MNRLTRQEQVCLIRPLIFSSSGNINDYIVHIYRKHAGPAQ